MQKYELAEIENNFLNHLLNDKFWTPPNWKILQTTIWTLIKKWHEVLQTGRKHCGKRRNCSFFHHVFKRLVQKTRKNQSLFGKGFILSHTLSGIKMNVHSPCKEIINKLFSFIVETWHWICLFLKKNNYDEVQNDEFVIEELVSCIGV